jgi:hypothetical protein
MKDHISSALRGIVKIKKGSKLITALGTLLENREDILSMMNYLGTH